MIQKKALLLFLILAWAGYPVAAQKPAPIQLKEGKGRTKLHSFRMTDVRDDREDTTTIGNIRPAAQRKPVAVDLQGGSAAAFMAYIARTVSQPPTATPLALYIRKLEVVLSTPRRGERLTLHYSYAFYQEGTSVMQYEGESYAEASSDASRYCEQLIRTSISQTLERADEAWKKQAADTVRRVTASVHIAPGSASSGNIFWSPGRPLTFEDYKGKPDDLSIGDAATYSGISMSVTTKTEGPRINLSCSITAAFAPTRSWFRPKARTTRVLAHEQLHFDITALCACILADKIRKTTFSPKTYTEELEALQAESDARIQKMQEQYDTESSHGRDTAAQDRWTADIRARLAALDCKND